MADSDAMVRSVRAGKRVKLDDVGLFSDATAVKLVGEETFRMTRALVDDFIVVDTDAVCAGIKDVFEDTRSIMEPAGAMGVAAIKQYVARHELKDQVAGGHHVRGQHELRPVAVRRRARRGGRGTRGAVRGHDPGEARQLQAAVRDRRRAQRDRVQLPDLRQEGSPCFRRVWPRATAAKSAKIAQAFAEHGFAAVDLVGDELSKEHVRYMVGGRSPLARDERLYRFLFPERPGALMRFLTSMHPNWNISLFHYRNQGADHGRILIGIQVPAGEKAAFQQFVDTLGYPYVDETENPAYHLFLRLKKVPRATSGGPLAAMPLDRALGGPRSW